MAACDPFHFHGITPDIFNSITKELAGKGFFLTGPRGLVNGPFGIVIDYEWNEFNGTLSIEVIEKSFFISCNQIKEQIANALKHYV